MSRRLLQLVIPVTPDRRMFRIHDPSVDPDAPGGPPAPVSSLISTNREQLWVGSLQEDIDVRLVLEEWDEAPPPCADAWDEEAKSSIYLRGQLSISMGLAGTAVRGLRLGGGVGDYSVRVYAGNRDVVTRRYSALFEQYRNPLSDEFQQEKRALEGLERYLVQLWRESLAEVALGHRGRRGTGVLLLGPRLRCPAGGGAGRACDGRVRGARLGAGPSARARGGRSRPDTGRLVAGRRDPAVARPVRRRAVTQGVPAERDHRVDHQRDHRHH
jgi:hypothetical protein